ncbi:MAG: phospho-N-acetylmuramoyl-pentapeptide-transferase, partial [Actinomycetota bacterium]
MISLLLSSAFAFVIVILVTPLAIRLLRRRNIGQFIQSEVEGHMHKQGVPTMGGIVIVGGAVAGYVLGHFKVFTVGEGFGFASQPMSDKALLAVFALVGMALIGFADDFVKFARKRNEGLSKRWKFSGQ